MQPTALYCGEAFSVWHYRCTFGPADTPYAEAHAGHSISYVRAGSFGCVTRGEAHEMVPGAVMLLRPGQEYMATHEHHGCGDECLSVQLSPALADGLFDEDTVRLPPLPGLMVLGELAQAAAEGRSALGVDEAAMLFVERVARLASGATPGRQRLNGKARRTAVEAALWLEANAAEPVRLEDAARQAGLSAFHFLRIFRNVIGVTPHQYLLRVRLRRAAKLLADGGMPVTEVALESGFADLSNFVRTFGRAAGVSPARFSKSRPAALA